MLCWPKESRISSSAPLGGLADRLLEIFRRYPLPLLIQATDGDNGLFVSLIVQNPVLKPVSADVINLQPSAMSLSSMPKASDMPMGRLWERPSGAMIFLISVRMP
jgi:hypothetical protein